MTLPRLIAPWNALTLSKLLESAARSRGDDIAYIDAHDTLNWLHRPACGYNYRDLAQAARNFARKLITMGLKRGDTVMLVLPNAVEFPIAAYGAMMVGIVPVLASITYTPEKLRQIAELSDAKAIITIAKIGDVELASTMRSIALQVYSIKAIASFGADLPEGVIGLDSWEEADLDDITDHQPLSIYETSLITAEFIGLLPCALSRTQGQLIAETVALSSTAHINGQTQLINTIVPSSSFSFITSIVLPLLVRAPLHFHGVFSSQTLVEQIKACDNATLIAPLSVEQGIAELGAQTLETVKQVILLHRFEQDLPQPSSSKLLKSIVDVCALGEAAHIALARKGAGFRAELPQNWRQPGMRVVENDMLLVQARVSEDNTLTLAGFGVATVHGASIGSSLVDGYETQLVAQLCDGQTFKAYVLDEAHFAPTQSAQSAA